ncbi:MAG: hypothetical protein ACRBM6_03065 [Geminicoccales bacterium]
MGVFDLPAPVFTWLDQMMSAVASPSLRLVVWGLVAAVLSMGLYWAFSSQGKIADIKVRALKARQDLNAHDGAFEEAWPMMRSMLGLSFRQLGLTTLPALLASIPVLALIVWLSTAYGYALPDGQSAINVQATPDTPVSAEVKETPGASSTNYPRLVITDGSGALISDIALSAPVPTIHKRQWWNRLFGNPLGYLPSEGAIEVIAIDLPEKEYLSVGPTWLRPWYVLFFTILVLGSLAIKMALRIE